MINEVEYIKDIKDPVKKAHILEFIRDTYYPGDIQKLVLRGIGPLLDYLKTADFSELTLRRQVNLVIDDYEANVPLFEKWDKLSPVMIRDLLISSPKSTDHITEHQFNKALNNISYYEDGIALLTNRCPSWTVDLDIRNLDHWTLTEYALVFPELLNNTKHIQWAPCYISKILMRLPEQVDKFDLSQLKGVDWVDLILEQKHFADQCDWSKLDADDWCFLLTDNLKYKDHCDWSLFDDDQWEEIGEQQPTLLPFIKEHKDKYLMMESV